MRLLFIDFKFPYLLKDDDYPVGGWTVQLNNWLNGLQEVGHDVGVLTWKGANEYTDNRFSQTLIETYAPHKGIAVAKYFYSYIPAILNAARKYQPDVIIQATSNVHTGILSFVSRKLEIPFVHRVSSDIDTDARIASKLKKYQLIAYHYGIARADMILCQNHYQYTQLRRHHPNKIIKIFSNPFDTNQPLPMHRPRTNKKYIAWLGVFKECKNLPLLLSIARELPKQEFRIAGMPPSKMTKETSEAIEALKQLRNVTFVGYVKRKEVMNFLANSLSLLSTSHYEGFSNTFLESLIAGTPIIAPLRVDPDHFISKNKLGLISEDGNNLPLLISKMCNMDEEKYELMTKRCHSYVMDHHSPVAKAEELVQLLQPVVGKR